MSKLKVKKVFGILALGAALSIGAASSKETPQPTNASIAFANHGGINDWRANGDEGIWVQDSHRQWYYAKFMGTCFGLPFANSVGFATGPVGNLDRFSYVLVRDSGRCYFQSFERSAGPAPRAKSAK